MKSQRKHPYCLNCNTPLKIQDNYCPKCGQENTDQNVSVGIILSEFISNAFALDGKLPKSFVPFLFKPGKLTNTYNAGKRNKYFNPVRMYLVLSLFYFFVIGYIGKKVAEDIETQSEKVFNRVSSDDPASLSKIDSLINLKSRDSVNWEAIKKEIEKDTGLKLPDSLNKEKPNIIKDLKIDSVENGGWDTNLDFTEKLYSLAQDESLSIEQCIDSLDVNKSEKLTYALTYQSIKIIRSDKRYLIGYILKNLPIMMFILLPVFAGMLKLLYIRRNFLYIHHIIHALYLHSFAYLVYGLTLLITVKYDLDAGLAFFSFILVSTYSYISFIRVYKQGWFKTFVKFNILGYFYISFLLIAFLIELMLSLYLF
ncbi:DUF3667 domain-containing protein [Mangrovivirga sp. M17]|uniref:DUF3667 domain-containing protein n=1 Tax=Mangrovivirga halotolerans TaxID=2993936 RepID=A0ABT3RLP5_9BACT|nr:DUF3667 domain-containing protein [Mangrovivirga halotolerans]MCX2742485.1 DUF3667 domain-containing protein [Mangrovivirga halotolerans]